MIHIMIVYWTISKECKLIKAMSMNCVETDLISHWATNICCKSIINFCYIIKVNWDSICGKTWIIILIGTSSAIWERNCEPTKGCVQWDSFLGSNICHISDSECWRVCDTQIIQNIQTYLLVIRLINLRYELLTMLWKWIRKQWGINFVCLKV